jgi:hypothetical protein
LSDVEVLALEMFHDGLIDKKVFFFCATCIKTIILVVLSLLLGERTEQKNCSCFAFIFAFY